MIAGENLYTGDWVCTNEKDGLIYQATWEEFKKGKTWKIPIDMRKGETLFMSFRASARKERA